LKFVTSFEDLDANLRSEIDDLRDRMDYVEESIENLTGMAYNHIRFIVLESIIVALLLVRIDGLMYRESTLL